MTTTFDVELTDVTRRFGQVVAVDQLDLGVSRGEFLSLLGPSGCGKTTTLRLVAGFERADAGRVTIGGVDVTHSPAYRRNVNTVFQSYALFPYLSVLDNVTYGIRRRSLGRTERERQGREILELVGLVGFEQRRPQQLSGGQQQRVALARALIMKPRVLLLDEPLGALDLEVRKRLQIELKRIQTNTAITFIYVTHDQEEALAMSDRIAVMNHGKIAQIGTPLEVYDTPATRFVAAFIGETNFINYHDRVIAIRPDRLMISSVNSDPGAPRTLMGRVRSVMLGGSSMQFIIVGDSGQEVVVRRLRTNDANHTPAIREGDEVVLSWTDDAVLNYQED